MDMKRILSAILLIVLVVSLTACTNQSTDALPQGSVEPSASPETTLPPQTESPSAQELEPYTPMDIFGAEFNPFGMDMPTPVFEARFEKGVAKLEGKNPFTLSMTSSAVYACIAFQADVAGLGLDDGGKNELVEAYRNNGEYLEFTGADGRIVVIRQANPDDDRYEYVESDGNQGFTGAGCVIELTYYVPDAELEKYTQLVQDNYSIEALSPIAAYFDTATDFSECGVSVNLYKNEVQTTVVYYVPDAETIRQNIAANVNSDWWEWYGNMETYIAYNNAIGNKLIVDSEGGAITVAQSNKHLQPVAEGSLTDLGFGFDEAGTCGVYEQRDPHYISFAIARPEWGDFPDDWNIEFMDTDINGYSLRITYHAEDGRYHISLDKDGEGCAYECYPEKDQYGWEYPDLDTVHRMFNDAFGTKEKELYFAPLEYLEQYVQEHFGMSVDELYAAPKQ
jgi:predicted small lipoprotein YifL